MKWPTQITKAHAACIPKENKTSHNPLACRVLLFVSQIYTKWATMRLKHLSPWIKRWALPQMYAGVPGQGAEQAWWQLSLCMEYWRTRQTQATGDYGHLQMLRSDCQATHLHDCEGCGHVNQSPHTSTSWKACKSETHSPSATERRTHVSAAYRRDVLPRWRSLLCWSDHGFYRECLLMTFTSSPLVRSSMRFT